MAKSNSKTQPPKLTIGEFKGNPMQARMAAKAQGSESGQGSRKKSTKND